MKHWSLIFAACIVLGIVGALAVRQAATIDAYQTGPALYARVHLGADGAVVVTNAGRRDWYNVVIAVNPRGDAIDFAYCAGTVKPGQTLRLGRSYFTEGGKVGGFGFQRTEREIVSIAVSAETARGESYWFSPVDELAD